VKKSESQNDFSVFKFRRFLSLISCSVVLVTPTLLPSCHLVFIVFG